MEFFERLRRRKVGFGQTWLLLERAIRSPLLVSLGWFTRAPLLGQTGNLLVSLVSLCFLNKISCIKKNYLPSRSSLQQYKANEDEKIAIPNSFFQHRLLLHVH
jgi:hypothetical protein